MLNNKNGADHLLIKVQDKSRILREAGAGLDTKDWMYPNPFKAFLPEDENPHQDTHNKVPHRTTEEKNYMYSHHNVPVVHNAASNHVNVTVDRTRNYAAAEGAPDARAPVTATIDATTIHYVNATVKPTLAPEVDGYEKVESAEVRIIAASIHSLR